MPPWVLPFTILFLPALTYGEDLWSWGGWERVSATAEPNRLLAPLVVDFDGGYQELWAGDESRSGFRAEQQRLGAASMFGDQFGWMTRWSTDLDGNDFDLFYELEDAVLFLRPDEATMITFGKQKVPFSRATAEPHFERLAFERSLVAGQISPKRNLGLLAARRGEFLEWRSGAYTSAQSGEERWPAFDGSAIFYAGVTRAWGDHELRLDAVYHNETKDSEGIDGWDQMLAGSFLTERGKLRFEAEGVVGWGVDLGPGEVYQDVWGVTLQPSVQLTETVQWFLRYQHAFGNDGGLKLYRGTIIPPPRGPAFGRRWNAVASGFAIDLPNPNFRFVGGVEWAHMDRVDGRGEFDGWTAYMGLRIRR